MPWFDRPQQWTVRIVDSIIGPIALSGRPTNTKGSIPASEFPSYVREFLCMHPDGKGGPGANRIGLLQDGGSLYSFDDLRSLDSWDKKPKILNRAMHVTFTVMVKRWQKPAMPPPGERHLWICSLGGLCEFIGAGKPADLNHAMYKGTSCGASISVRLNDGSWLHNGDRKWETLRRDAKIKGFTIQTIIEGSDATVDSHEFEIPCRKQEVKDWITHMEAEAVRLWEEANDTKLSHTQD